MTILIIIAVLAIAGFFIWRNNKAKASVLVQSAEDLAKKAQDAAKKAL